jgi:aldehyde dehydrogenase (NAD+)
MTQVINPATEETIAEVGEGTTADVDAAVDAARTALPGWAATPPADRAGYLRKLAESLEANTDCTRSCSKPPPRWQPAAPS